MNGLDFTLGRFNKDIPNAPGQTCRYHGWRPYWRPPVTHAERVASGQASCNASLIPGYLTMCPGTPSHAMHRVCATSARGDNATKSSRRHKQQEPALGLTADMDRLHNHASHKPHGDVSSLVGQRSRSSPIQDKLVELVALRDQQLITKLEYETLRSRVLGCGGPGCSSYQQ
jgi:hypothetical protein